ncbi:MAG TPA: Rieske 2Fe-2S domain-containing protein [Myxococcota bacterium]|nr:Rieske 2Fe-2S domain-containing protein [Myxococcota bacterium]
MFEDFRNVWTPVLLQRHLRWRPVGVQVAGERVVLFRDGNGRVAALRDVCPHRGVALSRGERTPSGALACGFHGWEFGANGVCTHIPFNPTAKCERLRVQSFPSHEEGGLIWLYTGEARTDVEPPRIPAGLRRAGPGLFASEVLWQTHWTRVMENMIDNAHVPVVHRRTIGWGLRRAMHRGSRMDVSVEPTDTGFLIEGVQDGRQPVGVHGFNRPNGMELYLDGRAGKLRIYVFCIPVHGRATRLLVVGDFGRRNWLSRIFTALNWYIVLEDRAVVETSEPAEVPPLGVEHCVSTDRGTLAFRKYYHDCLKEPRRPGRVERLEQEAPLRLAGG